MYVLLSGPWIIATSVPLLCRMPRTEISATAIADGPSPDRDVAAVSLPVPTRLRKGSRRPAGWYVNVSAAGAAVSWAAVAGEDGAAGPWDAVAGRGDRRIRSRLVFAFDVEASDVDDARESADAIEEDGEIVVRAVELEGDRP